MQFSRKLLLTSLIACACVAADQVTKNLARAELDPGSVGTYLWGFVRVQYELNSGAMFSLGADLPEGLRFFVFVVVMSALLVAILVLLLAGRSVAGADVVAGSLVVGGGAGNLIDRIVNAGYVTDFVSLGVGVIRTAVFNVADVAIVAGVILFAARRMRTVRTGSEPPGGNNGRDPKDRR